jgi:hypothetical protein
VDVLDLVSDFKALKVSDAVSIFVEFVNCCKNTSEMAVVLFENWIVVREFWDDDWVSSLLDGIINLVLFFGSKFSDGVDSLPDFLVVVFVLWFEIGNAEFKSTNAFSKGGIEWEAINSNLESV